MAIQSGGKKKKVVNFSEVVLFNSLASSKNHMILLGGKKWNKEKYILSLKTTRFEFSK